MKDKLKDISTGLIIYTLLGVMGIFLLPYASTSKENCLRVIKLYCRVVFWILKKFYNIEILVKGSVPDNNASIVCSKHSRFSPTKKGTSGAQDFRIFSMLLYVEAFSEGLLMVGVYFLTCS